MKTWTDDNPKAKLMAGKRELLVHAARAAFLSSGYADSSVNRIAQDAGVSIKTLYRHFESKDDLFSAVITGLCSNPVEPSADLPWSEQPPRIAFEMMGMKYLELILAPEEIALYRVIVRDNVRFPQLGECYREEALRPRQRVFAAYLDKWAPRCDWNIREHGRAVSTFFALLQRDLLEPVLLGGSHPTTAQVRYEAERAALDMLMLIERSSFAGASATRKLDCKGTKSSIQAQADTERAC